MLSLGGNLLRRGKDILSKVNDWQTDEKKPGKSNWTCCINCMQYHAGNGGIKMMTVEMGSLVFIATPVAMYFTSQRASTSIIGVAQRNSVT